MASQLIREWTGIQHFPLVTQSKLLDSLGILKNEKLQNLAVLPQTEVPAPLNSTYTIRFLLNKTVDILLYVDQLDTYRVDNLDKQVVQAITDSFGKEIWTRALVVLTHAQLLPPDGMEYDVFSSKRSEGLLKVVRQDKETGCLGFWDSCCLGRKRGKMQQE